jgi:hypothetical protein
MQGVIEERPRSLLRVLDVLDFIDSILIAADVPKLQTHQIRILQNPLKLIETHPVTCEDEKFIVIT